MIIFNFFNKSTVESSHETIKFEDKKWKTSKLHTSELFGYHDDQENKKSFKLLPSIRSDPKFTWIQLPRVELRSCKIFFLIIYVFHYVVVFVSALLCEKKMLHDEPCKFNNGLTNVYENWLASHEFRWFVRFEVELVFLCFVS